MVNNLGTNYSGWLLKAGEDELSIDAIFKGVGAYSTVCFLSQQMAEKYLKSLIIFNNMSFPKVHDLLELETILLDIEPEVSHYEHDLDLLNSYYVETRYPGDYPEFTLKEAQEAFEAAKRIKEYVLAKINRQ